MLRLALCCQFIKQPIKFRTTTLKYARTLDERGEDPLEYLGAIVLDNAQALIEAIDFCAGNGIGAFRINSQLMPLASHDVYGFSIDQLPQHQQIRTAFQSAAASAKKQQVRLSFHPDQFVVLSSPNPEVVRKSLAELEYHGEVAELLGADVINIHGGGGYGDKQAALQRFAASFDTLSDRTKQRLTVENDDKVFTPEELLPLCRQTGIPLVYDAHHHRCLPDALSIEQASEQALKTWNREPLFHISSPKDGWGQPKPQLHHDYIDPADMPECWKQIDPLTVDVEAKAKELAVLKLRNALIEQGWNVA